MRTFPKRAVRLIFFALLCAICFLDYWSYSVEFHKNPGGNLDLIAGTAAAPQQYRVLVVRAAWMLQQHTPIVFRYSFTLFDFVSGAAAGLLLLKLLERSAAFRRVGSTGRWLGYAAFLFLFAYYLLWLDWYQRPETLPTTCLLSFMLALLSWRTSRRTSMVLIAILTFFVSFLQGLTRADVAVCFYAGAFLYAALSRKGLLPAARLFLLTLSAAAAAVALAVQWFLMHRVYPHASYGSSPVFQLRMNVLEPLRMGPFLIFMAPVLWTLWGALRRQQWNEPAPAALAIATVLFLPLWLVLGKIDEVRIFLPFAVALIPLSVSHLLGSVAVDEVAPPTS